MIFAKQMQIALPRRVVVYYLFFCLAAVCWLSVGVVLTTQSVLSGNSQNASLTQLGRTAAGIEVEYVRHGDENLQPIVQRAQAESQFAYCAIVGVDGKYLAHTNKTLVGKTAVEPVGTLSRWGDVEGLRYVDAQDRSVIEYQVSLEAQNKKFGEFQAGTISPGLWDTLSQTADVAPLAVLVPLFFVTIGAFVLSRQAKPWASIEKELRRLARLPLNEPVTPQAQRPNNAAALGWNRVVDSLGNLQQHNNNGSSSANIQDAGSHDNDRAKSNVSQDSSFIANLPEGLAITDADGIILQANPTLAVMLATSSDVNELIGDPLESHLPTEGCNRALDDLTAKENLQRNVVVEVPMSGRYLRVARYPRRREDDTIFGYVWQLRDVSQQKMADEMRKQFMDAATHELRTPLANIKAYAETLSEMDESDIESQKEFCNTINSEASRLARFVDDLLSVSSMEVGALTIERQNIETLRLMEEVVNKIQPLMNQKSIQFECNLPAKLPELHLDKDKVVATMVNLLGNAAKYTPEGGRVVLKVKTAQNKMQIDVEDNGVGIAEHEVAKVFDKFFRSEDPRVLEETGSGLGLSLAREVIRLHGGDIHVSSEIDKGSTFSIILPMNGS